MDKNTGQSIFQTAFSQTSHDGIVDATLRIPADSMLARYVSQYAPLDFEAWEPAQYTVVKNYETDQPAFLTVVTRTVGERMLELEEMLLCLTAQSNQDFEVCIVGHNVDETRSEAIAALVTAQPPSLRKRITFIVSHGEGRARPLNAGFAAARSPYVTILDDDDLVYDNWIETFHTAAHEHPGQIIHCGVIDQAWEMREDAQGRLKPRAIGAPGSGWCLDFDFIEQFGVNRCPIMSLAFPLFAFRDLGITFDESLSTTEDWDFLMRTAFVCGVHSLPQATSMYRLWQNADNSRTVHDHEEWAHNRLTILDKFRHTTMLTSGELTDVYMHCSSIEKNQGMFLDLADMRAMVRGPQGEQLSELLVGTPDLSVGTEGGNRITFEGLSSYPGGASLHVVFPERQFITLRKLALTQDNTDGTRAPLALVDTEHNGILVSEDELAFIDPHPWIDIPLTSIQDTADVITLSFLFAPEVDQSLLEGTRLVLRTKNTFKKLARTMHKKRS